MNLSAALLAVSGLFYGLAFLIQLLSFKNEEKEIRAGFALMRIAFLASTFYLAAEAIDQGFFLPVANLSQAFAFFAWSLAFVYLVLLVKIQNESFGLVLSPILGLFILAAFFCKQAGPDKPLNENLLNPYFVMHIISAFFAYACFTLSFAAALLYLIQHAELKARRAGTFYHKLPSLEELERLIYQPVFWGVPLIVIAIAIGFFWSKVSFGRLWILDPKTVTTGLTAVLYSGILYSRSASLLRGKQAAVLSLMAFGFVILSFVGTRFIPGAHYIQ